MKNREQAISLAGVILLALVLPGILKLSNSVVRYFVGAEGRLAAITVETGHPLGPLPQPWRGLAQGGDQLKTFLDNKTGQVAALRPRYIRVDHIYDQFNTVSRQDNQIKMNWAELDMLVDKISATGAKPFLALSYMPPAISAGGATDEPKNWQEWSFIVQKTIEHFSGEKGIPDIYYEVWNEPDLFGKWTISGKKDYKSLYFYSAKGAMAARNVQPFKLGGPGTTGLYKNWLDEFFPFVLQNNLKFDFFSWHRYDLDLGKYAQDTQNIDHWLESHPYFSHVEKIISEMGPHSEAGWENNSMLGAAHLAATSRELMYRINMGLSFAVSGQWGVLGKPREETLKMLAKLNGERLAITGEGSWVRAIGAQDGDTIRIMLVNYDPRGMHSEVVPVTFVNLKNQNFNLRRDILGGISREQKIATTEAILQQTVPLSPNSVVLLTLSPISP